MRRLWIVLAVVFATLIATAAGVQAATSSMSKSKVRHHLTMKQKVMAARWIRAHRAMSARMGRGPKLFSRRAKMRKLIAARMARGPKWVCHRVRRHIRKARPATIARGPIINVPQAPAPVVNVPQQAAPVVNVPQQPAPVVNVPAFPPGVAVTVDNCNIYVVQGNQLMVFDKNTFCLKQTVPITGATAAPTGAGP